ANSPEARKKGARPFEVAGLALPLTERVMSLATGGQTLLTKAVFDLARRALVGARPFPDNTQWLAHGPYLLKGIDDPVEICEVGIQEKSPLAAPGDSEKARRAVAIGDEITLGWRPASSQAIPGRPNFKLVEKIGEGGFGEVWLGQQVKTHEK